MKDKVTKHFEEIAICLKPLLREAKGEVGVFLVERQGAGAAIIVADSEKCDNAHLIKALKLFQKRLEEMIHHSELNIDGEDRTFIRDEETGEYHQPGDEESTGFSN